MTRRAILGLVGFLVGAWTANLAVVVSFGVHQELYPFTAWPMFSAARPRRLRLYRFELSLPASTLALPVTEMVRGDARTAPESAQRMLRRVARRLDAGEPLPPELRALWFVNAGRLADLSEPAARLRLVEREYDLECPVTELGSSPRLRVVAELTLDRGVEP